MRPDKRCRRADELSRRSAGGKTDIGIPAHGHSVHRRQATNCSAPAGALRTERRGPTFTIRQFTLVPARRWHRSRRRRACGVHQKPCPGNRAGTTRKFPTSRCRTVCARPGRPSDLSRGIFAGGHPAGPCSLKSRRFPPVAGRLRAQHRRPQLGGSQMALFATPRRPPSLMRGMHRAQPSAFFARVGRSPPRTARHVHSQGLQAGLRPATRIRSAQRPDEHR